MKKIKQKRKRKNPEFFTPTIVQNWIDTNAYKFRQKNGRLDVEKAIIAMVHDYHRQTKITDTEFTIIYSKMLDNLWPKDKEILKIQTQKISSKEMFEDDYGKMFGKQTAPVMYGSDLGYKSPRQTFITRKNPKRKKRKLK